APFFAAAVAAEARRRYGIESLADAGLILLSTLDEVEQAAAAAAVETGVADLAGRVGERGAPLQAALVALDPLTGGARAWVGGRDFRASQFDRVSQMRRQAGSTFKPVVYAAAFAGEVATPATLIADEPLLLELAGRQWSPKNDDGEFLGWISARTAVERSRNLPTVRLALEVGLPPIVDLARRLGVASPLSPVPALALGAFELSPLELATVYSVFASGGVRPPVHTLDGVLDGRGQPLAGTALPPPERVLSPEAAYLVTSLLEGVVAHGTGQRARQLGLTDPVAGKTGTTNQKRDAWFAGFAPGKVALAWVGYDEDRLHAPDPSARRLRADRAARRGRAADDRSGERRPRAAALPAGDRRVLPRLAGSHPRLPAARRPPLGGRSPRSPAAGGGGGTGGAGERPVPALAAAPLRRRRRPATGLKSGRYDQGLGAQPSRRRRSPCPAPLPS
ncbi:MAG TPA: penicillin-binding transpeptidase domain-containing protein, partial [Thermoanaerobaculia bacterium]|nr:penicillin-binding transpeptidase domain-containing protein [Thermoanaerobaculia bacterium]